MNVVNIATSKLWISCQLRSLMLLL